MAYLFELNVWCDAQCGRRAVLELRTKQNETVGKFCRGCAGKRLRGLEEAERGSAKPLSPAQARRKMEGVRQPQANG